MEKLEQDLLRVYLISNGVVSTILLVILLLKEVIK